MNRSLLLIAFCLLGASALYFKARKVIPKSLQVKNYPGQCAANDQATTKTCLDSYFKTYGFDTSKGLPEYFEYIAKTGSLVQLYGVTGFDIYCDFESTLETCLGNLMTSACMNPDGFTKMYGTNETEAIDYATTFPVELYTCQNKDLAKSYYPCMTEMDTQGLIDCTVELEKGFEDATDTCAPFDKYVTCMENYYVKSCDEGIRSYICNTEEIAFNFDLNGMCQDKLHQC